MDFFKKGGKRVMASALVNAAMLKWAREQTPFKTVYEVSKRKPTIKPDKLLAWENGTESPSITSAKELATLYKLPLAAFFLDVPPEKSIIQYKDRRTITGTLYRDDNYELWAETQRVNSNRELILSLVEDEKEIMRIPQFDNDTSINELATAIRMFLGIQTPFEYKKTYSNNAFRYYRGLLEDHDISVTQINGVELTEMRGFSLSYDVIPIIGINGKDYERAKVFTLFHELAHIIRRTSSICMINFDSRNDDEEKICDRIAATILMPENEFNNVVHQVFGMEKEWTSLCLVKIADKFGVSSASVIRRLFELSIISKGEYHALFEREQAEFEAMQSRNHSIPRAEEHQKYINKQGVLFTKTVLSAFNRGSISYGELCRTLNLKSRHIGKLERLVMFG